MNFTFLHEGHATDLILFHRFKYYVEADPVLTDKEFDMLEEAVARSFPHARVLQAVGSSDPASYPPYIREGRRPTLSERLQRDRDWCSSQSIRPIQDMLRSVLSFLSEVTAPP